MKSKLIILFILLSSLVYGNELQDIYIEVKYFNYHFVFTIEDNLVEYRDRNYYLSYKPESEIGYEIVKYWQEDFLKRYQYRWDDNRIEWEDAVKYRLDRGNSWTRVSFDDLSGRLLLSLQSRIQRFPLEERRLLIKESKNEE